MARGIEIGRGFIAVDLDDEGARNALSRFGSAAGTAFKAVAVGAGVVSAAAIKMAFDFNSLKEQSLVAFETLLGSGDKAKKMFTDLQKFAASTPFELPGLVDNARQLLGVGVAADKVIPTLTALGNTAGALGINQEHFNNILLAVTQSMGKGKLQGEELMQMVENGIPVWQLLAKATGKSIPELQKLSSEGKLLAADTLPKLFDQMQKDYGGAMAKQATTLSGVWSSLKDNTKILAGTALEPLFNIVKQGVGALGDLAQSDAGQAFAKNFAKGLQTAIDVSKNFFTAVKRQYGDDFSAIFSQATQKANGLWSTFKDDGIPILVSIGKTVIQILPPLLQLAQTLSGLLRPAFDALKTVLQAVAANAGNFANLISTAAGVVNSVAGPAIKIFGTVLGVVADTLGLVVNLIGDLSGPLGAIAGVILVSIASWRLLSTAISGVSSAISAIRPSTIAEALNPLSKRIDNVALSAGVMTESFTGSSKAGERVAVTGSKVGSALTKVGSVLPLVGIGVAAVGTLFELAAQHGEDLAKVATDIGKSMVAGGSSSLEASRKLEALQKTAGDAGARLKELDKSINENAASLAESDPEYQNLLIQQSEAVDQYEKAQKAAEDYTLELGPLGVAQLRVAQAQKDYNDAVTKYGATSPAAIAAQKALITETRNLEGAQKDAAKAAKDQNQNLLDLANTALASANADLQLRQAQQGVNDALKNAQDATSKYGKTSDEASNANLNLEASLLRSAEAAKAKARADNNGKTASEVAAAENKAYTEEVLRLAVAAGSNAPPALQQMLLGLNGTGLAAAGAKVKIDDAGRAVVSLPDGRVVHIYGDNSDVLRALQVIESQYERVKRDLAVPIVIYGSARIKKDIVEGERAMGGPVEAGKPYLVGEEGPEIIYPDRAGFVATHQQSQQIANAGGFGGGTTFNIYDATDPYGTAMYAERLRQFKGRLR